MTIARYSTHAAIFALAALAGTGGAFAQNAPVAGTGGAVQSGVMTFDDIRAGYERGKLSPVTTQYAEIYGVSFDNAFLFQNGQNEMSNYAIVGCESIEACNGAKAIALRFDPPVKTVTLTARATGAFATIQLVAAGAKPRAKTAILPLRFAQKVTMSRPDDSIAGLTILTAAADGFVTVDDIAFERTPPAAQPAPAATPTGDGQPAGQTGGGATDSNPPQTGVPPNPPPDNNQTNPPAPSGDAITATPAAGNPTATPPVWREPVPPQPDTDWIAAVAGAALAFALGAGGLWARNRMRLKAMARVSSRLEPAPAPRTAAHAGAETPGISIVCRIGAPAAPAMRIVPEGEDNG